MRRLALVGLAPLSTLLCFGILAGCGDNTPRALIATDGGGNDADAAKDAMTDTAVDGTDGGETGETGASCTGVAFTAPTNNAMLTAADDASGDACGDGFQFDVKATATGVAAGTTVMLRGTMGATTAVLATATVAAGAVTFDNVKLSPGMTTLTVVVGGTTCAATVAVNVDCSLPTVEVIAPVGDVTPFADKSKRLLASTATQELKDQNAATAGAQTDVVACSNKMGSAKLFVGHMGDAMLTQLGATVNTAPAAPADNCPNGLSFVAKFPGVTLPESTEVTTDGATLGNLLKATALTVSVTDAAASAVTGTSDEVDLWVDSSNPTLTEKTPTPLCGSTQNAPGVFTSTLTFNSSTPGVTLAITNGTNAAPMPPAVSYAAGTATFTNVMFPQGLNTVVATATEPSGNAVVLAPPAPMTSCTVTVGVGPIITFVTPPSGSKLCAVGNTANGCLADSNAVVPGWQNDITVQVSAGGVPQTTGTVSFSINMGAPVMVNLGAGGTATLTGAAIPEGTNIPVTVTTSMITGFGVGTTTATYNVDTLPPAAPTGLTAVPLDRRQTSFTLGWTAPQDQGQPGVSGYQIHAKRLNAAMMNPCGTEVKEVAFTTTPKTANMAESVAVTGLLIETDYCFTVAATDAVGNVSATVTAMGRANFNSTTLAGTGTEQFGIWTDATSDFGGPTAPGFTNDRLSDLLVGTNSTTSQRAYMFFGRSTGYATTPDVTFTGPAGKRFGQAIVAAGDLDGDTLADIAISAPGAMATDVPVIYIFSRKNAPWAVAGGWPATLDASQASYTITADASYGLTAFGQILTRVGNIDGAGRDDLAIGSYLYDPASGANAGRVVIVKGSDTFGSITLPDATNTIVIDGEASEYRLGRAIQALSDNTLVIAAPNSVGGAGRLYAFRSPYTSTFTADATSAFDSVIFAGGNGQYGTVLSTLGPIGSAVGVVTASATGAGGNFVDLLLAQPADGVFAGAKGAAPTPAVRFTSSSSGNSVGVVNLTSYLPGAAVTGSLIGGDTVPDLVIAGQADATLTVYIVNGSAIPSLTGTVDLATAASGVVAIKNKLPTGWVGYGRNSTLATDLNGDGYADIVLGESTNMAGRAVALW